VTPQLSPDAVLVDVVRTPIGVRNGSLSGWHPADLAGFLFRALAERNGLDPATVDDVVLGCVTQVGAQALDVGRNAVLAAGWPHSVPAATVDRQCTSGQQAVHAAAHSVVAGAAGVVVAAGVEVMSLVPLGAAVAVRDVGQPFPPSIRERYEPVGGLQPQGIAAELVAERYGLSREALDAYGQASQDRAAAALAAGRFVPGAGAEIVAVPGRLLDREAHRVVDTGTTVSIDGGVRPTTAESLAALRPAHTEAGVITAGNSAQISDGAAAALIMSEARAVELGLAVRGRFRSFATAAVDPVLMHTGPVPATAAALARAGLIMADIAVAEVHEGYAAAVLAWLADTGADPERVNPNGGAIALGHPLGCSGVRMLATLTCELERRGGGRGLLTMGGTGGLATALVLEVG